LGVNHAGETEVVDVPGLPGDFGLGIHPEDALAYRFPFGDVGRVHQSPFGREL